MSEPPTRPSSPKSKPQLRRRPRQRLRRGSRGRGGVNQKFNVAKEANKMYKKQNYKLCTDIEIANYLGISKNEVSIKAFDEKMRISALIEAEETLPSKTEELKNKLFADAVRNRDYLQAYEFLNTPMTAQRNLERTIAPEWNSLTELKDKIVLDDLTNNGEMTQTELQELCSLLKACEKHLTMDLECEGNPVMAAYREQALSGQRKKLKKVRTHFEKDIKQRKEQEAKERQQAKSLKQRDGYIKARKKRNQRANINLELFDGITEGSAEEKVRDFSIRERNRRAESEQIPERMNQAEAEQKQKHKKEIQIMEKKLTMQLKKISERNKQALKNREETKENAQNPATHKILEEYPQRFTKIEEMVSEAKQTLNKQQDLLEIMDDRSKLQLKLQKETLKVMKSQHVKQMKAVGDAMKILNKIDYNTSGSDINERLSRLPTWQNLGGSVWFATDLFKIVKAIVFDDTMQFKPSLFRPLKRSFTAFITLLEISFKVPFGLLSHAWEGLMCFNSTPVACLVVWTLKTLVILMAFTFLITRFPTLMNILDRLTQHLWTAIFCACEKLSIMCSWMNTSYNNMIQSERFIKLAEVISKGASFLRQYTIDPLGEGLQKAFSWITKSVGDIVWTWLWGGDVKGKTIETAGDAVGNLTQAAIGAAGNATQAILGAAGGATQAAAGNATQAVVEATGNATQAAIADAAEGGMWALMTGATAEAAAKAATRAAEAAAAARNTSKSALDDIAKMEAEIADGNWWTYLNGQDDLNAKALEEAKAKAAEAEADAKAAEKAAEDAKKKAAEAEAALGSGWFKWFRTNLAKIDDPHFQKWLSTHPEFRHFACVNPQFQHMKIRKRPPRMRKKAQMNTLLRTISEEKEMVHNITNSMNQITLRF